MRGPACIFWANLTPFSLKAAVAAANAALRIWAPESAGLPEQIQARPR
jgi:hypothetical protein